jgi:hypothetical protein
MDECEDIVQQRYDFDAVALSKCLIELERLEPAFDGT